MSLIKKEQSREKKWSNLKPKFERRKRLSRRREKPI